MITSNAADGEGEDINSGGLLAALFIVLVFVVGVCVCKYTSVRDFFCFSYLNYARGMEELITASRDRTRAVVAPISRSNGDHRSAVASPIATGTAIDVVRSLTREEREQYVSDLLNTQKLKVPDKIVDLDENAVQEWDQKVVNIDASVHESQRVEEYGNISIRNCAICLEEFAPNDFVCSSKNPDCDHVYHRQCIFDWLLKNEDCPCCRRGYLAY